MMFLLASTTICGIDTRFEAAQIWLDSIYFSNRRACDLFNVCHSSVCAQFIIRQTQWNVWMISIEITRIQKQCSKNVYVRKLTCFSKEKSKLNCLNLIIIIVDLRLFYVKFLSIQENSSSLLQKTQKIPNSKNSISKC